MKIAIVVAHSSNGIIGRDGQLPWHLPGDMRHFKDLTTGHAVVMGRKTYQSIPEKFRPLPQRVNVVVSRNMQPERGCMVASSLDDALDLASEGVPDAQRLFVIGGASIYQIALSLAHEVYLTLVEDYVDGDARFPLLPEGQWSKVDQSGLYFDNDLEYRFIKLERVAP